MINDPPMHNVQRLLTELSQPAAYPYAVDAVTVQQTHISMVFLAGAYVYKVKKPVQLGFLDFSTLQRRKHFCEEEVRLNRRLAPDVYLGVVPVVECDGRLHFEGAGKAVEWAVKMRCLPHEATLESRLERDEVTPVHLAELARRLARFHETAATNEHVASFGRFEVSARNCRENFEQTAAHVGTTVQPVVWRRVRQLTEQLLGSARAFIDERAAARPARDTHGDLRLDHVYHFPEQALPDDWLIIDCIEFNERFRYADPIADVAFLVMDLAVYGRRDLARALARAYLDAAGDAEAAALFPLYVAYRALVRAKVEGIKFFEREVPAADRDNALQAAKAHWLLAHSLLEPPVGLPFVVVVAGLPGTGKSALAEALAARLPYGMLRSDAVRKELAGVATDQSLAPEYYTPEWSQRVYAELARRMVGRLEQGERVVIDANFRQEGQRRMFLDLAIQWGVPALMLHCQASDDVVRERLRQRQGDASDADWNVYQQLAATWEPIGAATRRDLATLDANQALEGVVEQAMRALEASAWL
jgi:aminoglycoside phosphotransferase family enzyme/predicted kinase